LQIWRGAKKAKEKPRKCPFLRPKTSLFTHFAPIFERFSPVLEALQPWHNPNIFF
jgi:hypothetical protein